MEKIDEIFSKNDIKLTNAREIILDKLISANTPLCYEDIKDSLPMDKATFYRNISKFEEKSIVTSFESNDKKRYFEIQKNPHAHFICNICNKIECLNDFYPLKKEGYIVENIIIKGICPNCN